MHEAMFKRRENFQDMHFSCISWTRKIIRNPTSGNDNSSAKAFDAISAHLKSFGYVRRNTLSMFVIATLHRSSLFILFPASALRSREIIVTMAFLLKMVSVSTMVVGFLAIFFQV